MLLHALTVLSALDADQYPMAGTALHLLLVFAPLQVVFARLLQVLKYVLQQILEDCHLLVAYALHVLELYHQRLHA